MRQCTVGRSSCLSDLMRHEKVDSKRRGSWHPPTRAQVYEGARSSQLALSRRVSSPSPFCVFRFFFLLCPGTLPAPPSLFKCRILFTNVYIFHPDICLIAFFHGRGSIRCGAMVCCCSRLAVVDQSGISFRSIMQHALLFTLASAFHLSTGFTHRTRCINNLLGSERRHLDEGSGHFRTALDIGL